MFDHVTIRVSDRRASERFYLTVLETLGIAQTYSDADLAEWADFSLTPASADRPATRRLHVGFAAASEGDVEAFWQVGTRAGYRDDGAPGPRPQYREDYYGAFLLDPDGNSAEAVHHGALRSDGHIDHLWLRVADVPAARRFYETIGGPAGLRIGSAQPGHVHVVSAHDARGSFSLVAGGPTEHVHLAFPAADDAAVDGFHRAAVAAGYRDNGAPGERPEYHAGYYAAFALDPDGNNVEVVNHHR